MKKLTNNELLDKSNNLCALVRIYAKYVDRNDITNRDNNKIDKLNEKIDKYY